MLGAKRAVVRFSLARHVCPHANVNAGLGILDNNLRTCTAARNAGAASVAVSYGAHPLEGLTKMQPLATVHSIAELRAWLATNA